jgi:uncharacterized protein YllA (UPF0747 family)
MMTIDEAILAQQRMIDSLLSNQEDMVTTFTAIVEKMDAMNRRIEELESKYRHEVPGTLGID